MLSIKTYFKYQKLRILKALPCLSILGFIYILPFLINNNFYFENATWRAIGFVPSEAAEASGRVFVGPLLSFLSLEYDLFNHTGNQFLLYTGVSNLIISIFCLMIAALVFYTRVYRKRIDFYYLVVTFSFILNPFLLENFSFRTSCIYMILPIALSLIASSLNTKNRIFNIILASILIVLALGMYQSSFNTLCSAIVLIFLVDFYKNWKFAFKNLFENFLKLIIGISIYKFFILDQVEKGEYYRLNSQMFDFDKTFLAKIGSKFIYLFNEYLSIFNESRLIVTFVVIACLLYACHYIKKTTLGLIILPISISAIIFFCFGFIIFYKSSVYEPRVFGSVSVLFLLVFHMYYAGIKKSFPKLKFLLLVPLVYFLILGQSYTAMQESQYEFNKRIASSFISKLEDLGFQRKDRVAFASNGVGPSQYALNSIRKNKILRRLYIETLYDNWYSYLFTQFLGLETPFVHNFSYKKEKQVCRKYPALYTSPYYKIIKPNDEVAKFVVAFKNGPCYRNIKTN